MAIGLDAGLSSVATGSAASCATTMGSGVCAARFAACWLKVAIVGAGVCTGSAGDSLGMFTGRLCRPMILVLMLFSAASSKSASKRDDSATFVSRDKASMGWLAAFFFSECASWRDK